MADYTMRTGDTYPDLTITLTETTTITDPKRYPDGNGGFIRRVDLSTAAPDLIRMVAKLASPPTVIEGPMENVEVVDGAGTSGGVSNQEPGLGVPANRGQVRYPFAAGDTDVPGDPYKIEVEITWDSASTPPKVETIPNESKNMQTLAIEADND